MGGIVALYKTLREALGIVLAVFSVSFGVVRAQDEKPPPETDEIVISATRIPTPEDESSRRA